MLLLCSSVLVCCASYMIWFIYLVIILAGKVGKYSDEWINRVAKLPQ